MRNGNQGAIEMTEFIEKFWRDATAADVVDVMNGKEFEARFRDKESQRWQSGFRLGGWMKCKSHPWLDGDASTWAFCQVYSPPQWFLDKPDPGEEYRLLGKEPDEAKHRDDEIFREGRWDSVGFDDGKQREGFWYRRKIDPKPEPKFAVGQRVRVVGPKQSPAVNWDRQMDKHNGAVAEVISVFVFGSKVFYDLRFVEQWAFREDYLEPAVEPKHYTLQVGDTVETPCGNLIKVIGPGVIQRHLLLKTGDTISTPSGRRATVTELGIEVS